jgi:hypothetical protein
MSGFPFAIRGIAGAFADCAFTMFEPPSAATTAMAAAALANKNLRVIALSLFRSHNQ